MWIRFAFRTLPLQSRIAGSSTLGRYYALQITVCLGVLYWVRRAT